MLSNLNQREGNNIKKGGANAQKFERTHELNKVLEQQQKDTVEANQYTYPEEENQSKQQ